MRNLPFMRLQSLIIVFISLGLFYSCSTNDGTTDVEEQNITTEENTWNPMGTGMGGDVVALTVQDGKLIAGGAFAEAEGQQANGLASWDGSQWQPMGTNPL